MLKKGLSLKQVWEISSTLLAAMLRPGTITKTSKTKKGTDLFNSSPSINKTAKIAEPGHTPDPKNLAVFGQVIPSGSVYK